MAGAPPHRFEIVEGRLPDEILVLAAEARSEGYGMVDRLVSEWHDGFRYTRRDETLILARSGEEPAATGGVTQDPAIPEALRMRRFYVRRAFRRSGLGRRLAELLMERAQQTGRSIYVHAGTAEGSLFWESLGFVREDVAGHTHILPDRPARSNTTRTGVVT